MSRRTNRSRFCRRLGPLTPDDPISTLTPLIRPARELGDGISRKVRRSCGRHGAAAGRRSGPTWALRVAAEPRRGFDTDDALRDGLCYLIEHEGRRQESPEEVEAIRAAGGRAHRDGGQIPGQEADVVFYSLASSSGDDIPRSLEFLFSRNRLNVAISRARCLAFLAASRRLLEVDAKTVEHTRLANALCRFGEVAEP
jgi:hypothetical protein